jgi:hypothetical protein
LHGRLALVISEGFTRKIRMASTIFHHWLDQYRVLPTARRRWLTGGVAALAAAVVFAVGIACGRGFGLPNGLEARAQRLAASNAALVAQNQSLAQQQQTAATTVAALKQTMASHDAELEKLRQEQAFYAKLIGIDGNRSGLGVHSVALSRVGRTDAWNFTVTLVNTAENADAARGTLTAAVEGVRNGKLATLPWTSLTGAGSQQGIPFAFKFFQQLQGSLALPKGFIPNRVALTLHPDGGSAITRKFDWSDALGQHGIIITTP